MINNVLFILLHVLKTRHENTIRLVTQPNHAIAAGHMASHWGNKEFTKLGFYGDCSDPESLSDETIFGIAEHDNGWWEWEADPSRSESDKLPLGLAEVLSNPIEATQCWQIGTTRFEDSHPYASLLMNYHAYRLYDVAREEEYSIHPLFGNSKSFSNENSPQATSLIKILENQQKTLRQRLDNLGGWHKDAISSKILLPNARMMQILDALSLYLCSNFIPPVSGKARGLGRDEVELKHIPRENWQDKIKMHIIPQDDNTLVCNPYPFDEENLRIPIVVTEIENFNQNEISLIELYKIPKKIINFTFSKI